jgi:hypothetical protein
MIGWPPRDGRKLIAMLLLSGGGMALTVSAWRTTTLVAERSVGDPWPLAYSLYGTLALLGLVLVSLGWVIGKTSIKGSVGAANFDLGGGESDAAVGAQLATDAAQEVAEELKP